MAALSKIRIETKGTVSKLFIDDVDFSDAFEAELLLKGGEIPLLRVTLLADDIIVNGEAVVEKETQIAPSGTEICVIGSPRIHRTHSQPKESLINVDGCNKDSTLVDKQQLANAVREILMEQRKGGVLE